MAAKKKAKEGKEPTPEELREAQIQKEREEDAARTKAIKTTLEAGKAKRLSYQEKLWARKSPFVKRLLDERDALREEVAKLKGKKK